MGELKQVFVVINNGNDNANCVGIPVKTRGCSLRNLRLGVGGGCRRNGNGIHCGGFNNPRRLFVATLDGLSKDEKQLKRKEYQSWMKAKNEEISKDIASFQASLEVNDALSPEQQREQWKSRIGEVRGRCLALQQRRRQQGGPNSVGKDDEFDDWIDGDGFDDWIDGDDY